MLKIIINKQEDAGTMIISKQDEAKDFNKVFTKKPWEETPESKLYEKIISLVNNYIG